MIAASPPPQRSLLRPSFGRRGVGDATPSRCPSIIVRQSSLDDGGDRYALAQDVVNFVNHATGEAMFRRDEAPQTRWRITLR